MRVMGSVLFAHTCERRSTWSEGVGWEKVKSKGVQAEGQQVKSSEADGLGVFKEQQENSHELIIGRDKEIW